MAVVIATGVNLEGRREVLGFDVIAAESEDGWAEFFKSLKERGLRGVQLVISDAHAGLKAAVRKVVKAEWQRCKVHFYRNVLVHVPAPDADLFNESAGASQSGDSAPYQGGRDLPAQRRLRATDRHAVRHEDWLTDDKAYVTFEAAAAEDTGAKVVPMAADQ